jgi:2,3-bisphosphoglycerate-dependent phosphoglycerate mutase
VTGSAVPFRDGHGDPELAAIGREQAERVAARLAGEPIDAIYETNLRRTTQTAAPLAAQLGLTPRVEAGLREVHLGDWEGELFLRMVAERHPLAERMWAEERWDIVPGAETRQHFADRVRGGVERIRAAHQGQRVVVFAHGGTIGQVVSLATGATAFAFGLSDNGSITRVVLHAARWVVRSYNDTAHLEPAFSVLAG